MPAQSGDDVVYLTFADALETYAAVVGGTAEQTADHLRSRDALESFVDGNKRTALVAMLAFLEINGHRVQATDRELADWIIGFSRGASPQEIADAIRPRLTGLE